jgi:hypothetical protein
MLAVTSLLRQVLCPLSPLLAGSFHFKCQVVGSSPAEGSPKTACSRYVRDVGYPCSAARCSVGAADLRTSAAHATGNGELHPAAERFRRAATSDIRLGLHLAQPPDTRDQLQQAVDP